VFKENSLIKQSIFFGHFFLLMVRFLNENIGEIMKLKIGDCLMSIESIIEKTNKMNEYLSRTDAIFEETKQSGVEGDFYQTVKPFVDEVHLFLDEWEKEVTDWVRSERPKNIFIPNILAAKENFKEIVVQAFYPKTSYKRFKEHVHSIHYILEKVLFEVNKNTKK